MTAAAQQMRDPFSGKPERLPLILGMDPGEHKGYCLIDPEDVVERGKLTTPRILRLSTTIGPMREALTDGLRDANSRPLWSMVELQYTSRVSIGEISPESIVKLAFRAGFMLSEAHALSLAKAHPASYMFAAPPGTWKNEIFPSGGTTRKDVFCEKVRRQLMPEEEKLLVKLPESHWQDALDSAGLAWSLWCALTTPDEGVTLEKWRVWSDHILPKSSKTPHKMSKGQRDKLRI